MRDISYVERVLAEWRRRELEDRARLRRELAAVDPRPRRSPVRLLNWLSTRVWALGWNTSRPTTPGPDRGLRNDGEEESDVGLARLRVRDVALLPAPSISESRTIVDALRLLDDTGAPGLLTTHQGRPAVVTRSDIELMLPSPATTLARYEVSALISRVQLREAVRGPTPVVGADHELRNVIYAMGEWGWRPLVVLDGDASYRLITPGAILSALVASQGRGLTSRG